MFFSLKTLQHLTHLPKQKLAQLTQRMHKNRCLCVCVKPLIVKTWHTFLIQRPHNLQQIWLCVYCVYAWHGMVYLNNLLQEYHIWHNSMKINIINIIWAIFLVYYETMSKNKMYVGGINSFTLKVARKNVLKSIDAQLWFEIRWAESTSKINKKVA